MTNKAEAIPEYYANVLPNHHSFKKAFNVLKENEK